jgi:murein DD-endopeptidase MepM/ murein hydrolase activator NlpD
MMIPPKKNSVRATQFLFFALIRPIGLCLSGLGLLGTTAVQAQTNGVEASRLLKAQGLSEVQMPPEKGVASPTSSPRSAIAPPESMVPEALPPVAAEPPVSQAPVNQAPVSQAPDAIVFSDRTAGCDTTMQWGTPVSPLCQQKAVAPAPKTVSRPETIGRATVESSGPDPDLEASASEETAPIVQWGPVSVGRSGVQFSAPAALKPYFNSNIKFAKMPDMNDLKMIFPLAIPFPITSLFGWRTHPISGEQRMHTGTDIGAPMGTPVLAAMTGRILLADFLGGYGMAVAIEHGQGSQQTLYAHLSALFVKPGEMVQQGAVIGRVGSTGNSTGPHLHFELRQQLPDGSWVAQDSGRALELAMGGLVGALQVAKNPQVLAQAIDKTKTLKTKGLHSNNATNATNAPNIKPIAANPAQSTRLKMQPSTNPTLAR